MLDYGVIDHTSYAACVREVTGQLPVFSSEFPYPDGTSLPTFHNEAYAEGRWFYVEVHAGNFGIYGPVAFGTVQERDPGHAEMINVFVADCLRRRGFGRLLMEIAGRRWPYLSWTGTPDSRPFHESLVRDGVARAYGHDFYEFVPRPGRAAGLIAKNTD
jgi:GNAT superfamily N-acetyltransferase